MPLYRASRMKSIGVLTLTLLLGVLACSVLSAPSLHSRESRNNEQEHLEVVSVDTDTGSRLFAGGSPGEIFPHWQARKGVTGGQGNRNGTSSQTIADFFHENKWMYAVIPLGGVLVIVLIVVALIIIGCLYWRHQKYSWSRLGRGHRQLQSSDQDLVSYNDTATGSHQENLTAKSGFRPRRPLEDNPEDNALRFFLSSNRQYEFDDEILDDLGSRVLKKWYAARLTEGEERKRIILTVAPLSSSCPLQMHKYQKGLNKLLGAIKVHPFLHPILEVAYLATHERIVIVQPKVSSGSLKDIIYKVEHPTLDWSEKYSHKTTGLKPERVARYGRQILEAMEFLYHKGFPTNALGHIQSGNIFVVNDVCQLGGYENTLLGYKTRMYRLCKDHLEHLDTILFGHLIFEMSAGYELKQLVPLKDDYKTINRSIIPILEFIFDDELSHSISDIKEHSFFDVLLPQMKYFNPAEVQLTDSVHVVLEKVRKNKSRVQKPPSAKLLKMTSPTSAQMTDDGLSDQPETTNSWKERFHMPKQLKQISKKKGKGMDGVNDIDDDDDNPLLDSIKDHLTESTRDVLEKAPKNKSLIQKPPSAKHLKMTSPTSAQMTDGGLSDQPETTNSWKERFHMPKQLKQISKKKGKGMDGVNDIDDDDDNPLLDSIKDHLTESTRDVLEKAPKNKSLIQKPPSAKHLKMTSPTSAQMTDGDQFATSSFIDND